jgi:inner membrane protein
MASAFTHGFVAVAFNRLLLSGALERRVLALGLLCAVLPDFDVLGFRVGIPYRHWLGHRGFFHSLPFAFLTGIIVMMTAFRDLPRFSKQWRLLALYFTVVTASHGLLDAMTDGGYGIAFFSPLDNTRYFLPWRPLTVSPIGVYGFLSRWGWEVIRSELIWVWSLLALLLAVVLSVRRLRSRRGTVGER